MGRNKKTADAFQTESPSRPNRWQARFEDELVQIYNRLDQEMTATLDELYEREWSKLSVEAAKNAEMDHVFGLLAQKVLSGEARVPSPILFRSWAKRWVSSHSEPSARESAPPRRSELSEKIAQLRRESDEREAERKANGTYRPLSSFRAVQNAAHYTRYRGRAR